MPGLRIKVDQFPVGMRKVDAFLLQLFANPLEPLYFESVIGPV